MAFQQGILGLVGSVGGLTCCRNGVVRARRRSDKPDFHHSLTREPNRQNATEFGLASTTSKLLRATLPAYLPARYHSRLTGALRGVIARDTTHPCGQRQLLPEHFAALTGFAVNPAARPQSAGRHAGGSLTPSPIPGQLTFTLPALPVSALAAPTGTTHYGFTLGLALFDPVALTCCAVAPGPEAGPYLLKAAPAPVTWPLALPASVFPASPALLIVLGVRFYESCAGRLLELPATIATPSIIGYAGCIPESIR